MADSDAVNELAEDIRDLRALWETRGAAELGRDRLDRVIRAAERESVRQQASSALIAGLGERIRAGDAAAHSSFSSDAKTLNVTATVPSGPLADRLRASTQHLTLEAAIDQRVRECHDLIDRLRDSEDLVGEDSRLLLEAVEIVRCARRLTRGRTVREIRDAFGAPGDFGYDTPIGDALSRLYRGEP